MSSLPPEPPEPPEQQGYKWTAMAKEAFSGFSAEKTLEIINVPEHRIAEDEPWFKVFLEDLNKRVLE